ncbi:MAG: T9SS type A sorting domain-containing protein, partial [Candidatus Cloacimonetes bacterium]|nr:T9SS type A sorting domain-containing protein [Candidatus Cloacimonadota bacterium]
TLRGFTITNGSGFPVFADQLCRGGGILIYAGSNVTLAKCKITHNIAVIGGGIFAFGNSMLLSGVEIYTNYAISQAGGISIQGSNNPLNTVIFDPINLCSIYDNYGVNPVDILITDIQSNLSLYLDMFSVNPSSSFYYDRHSNQSNFEQYHDTLLISRGYHFEVNCNLYVSPLGNDNNSGINSQYPMRSITKAIHKIESDSLNTKTVFIMPGNYNENENDQIYPIPLKSNVNIVGAGSNNVHLNSDHQCNLGTFNYISGYKTANSTVRGFSISDGINDNLKALHIGKTATAITLTDIDISNMNVFWEGAIFMSQIADTSIDSLNVKNITTVESCFQIRKINSGLLSNSVFENIHSIYSAEVTPSDDSWSMPVFDIRVVGSLSVENCVFRNIGVQNNQDTFGISIWDSITTQGADIKLNNCLFENIRTNNTRAMLLGSNSSSNYEVTNCTFYNNYSPTAAVGVTGNVSMRNNIFYNPDANKEIVMYSTSTPQFVCNLDMDYNNIRGGSASILNASFLNTLSYGEHNQDADPMFASTVPDTPNYLRLAPGSPCIDNGTPDISGLGLLPYDLAGNSRIWNGRIDMGCYEYGSEPWVANDDPYTPALTDNITAINYPNPFNPETTISFFLPVAGETELTIYNLKGQKVRNLLSAPLPTGTHRITWNGKDFQNRSVSSGIYFAKIEQANTHLVHKMMVMK